MECLLSKKVSVREKCVCAELFLKICAIASLHYRCKQYTRKSFSISIPESST